MPDSSALTPHVRDYSRERLETIDLIRLSGGVVKCEFPVELLELIRDAVESHGDRILDEPEEYPYAAYSAFSLYERLAAFIQSEFPNA